MNKISNFSNKKAFSLYVWLILFTLIISTASILIFNYVAADIKTATKFSKNINQAINFDSYAITAVELYKVNNLRSSDILNTGYRYSIEPIDSSTLLVNILKNSELYAKYIVQYSIDLGSINKIVGNPVEFKADNKYNNTLIAAENSRIDINANKIFNNLILAPNTQITGTNGTLITDFSKYTNNLITDIDINNIHSLAQNLNQYISSYYRNYYQALYNKYFDQSGNLKNGVALYEDNNIVFTNEGDLIIKSPARIKIYKNLFMSNNTSDFGSDFGSHFGTYRYNNISNFDTYIDIVIDPNITYRLAISNNLYIEGGNNLVFDYQTGKPLSTNDSTLASYYRSRVNYYLSYNNSIAKVIILPNEYISVKTPNTQFIILALNDIRILGNTDVDFISGYSDGTSIIHHLRITTIDKNILIVSKLDKNVTIDLPFRYYDYNTTNKSILLDSNSLIKVISNNIIIDARSYINDNRSNNIDITGIFSAFYNEDSTINIINHPNNVNITDVNINVFGAFQSYDSIKINAQNIFNTQAKEFYYSDPRVDKLNNIASLKIYRTQILAKEIIKFPRR